MATEPVLQIDMEQLTTVRVLGRGAMGTVFLVSPQSLPESAPCPRFALKVVDKATIHTKFDAARRARWEMTALAQLTHPFLPSLLGSLDNESFLGWAIPYCPGGDLNVLRQKQTDRVFSPAVIQFYVAEIILAIEYLHGLGIVYRDLKPENVLIQDSGHVMLTDFDLSRRLARRTSDPVEVVAEAVAVAAAEERGKHRRKLTRLMSVVSVAGERKKLKKVKSARVSPVSRRKSAHFTGERSNSFVGTEEYVSPEVVRGEGHEFAVDWWALGILIYEMLYAKTPFRGANRKETFRNVLSKFPEFVGTVPPVLRDLVSRLLEKDPIRRLGYAGGASDIKAHPFFRGLCWDSLHEVNRPPFVPLPDDKVWVKGINIEEYFFNLRLQTTLSPSSSVFPSPEPHHLHRANVSFEEI